MRILITGSEGFIGGSFARCVSRAGHEVLGIARRSQASTTLTGHHVQADVGHTDLAPCIAEFNPHVVFHATGAASVRASLSSPLDDFRASAMTWANLLDAVRRSGKTPLLMFPSSAAVYGNAEDLPIHESLRLAPISPYGFHKVICEQLGLEFSACFGLEIIACRIFSVFGPAQRRLLVWELYQQLTSSSDTIWLQGSGRESRDFLHVNDLAMAILHIANARIANPRKATFEAINIASGQETFVADLAEHMRLLVAPHKGICCHARESRGDPLRWKANVDTLRTYLDGWAPRPLSQALEACASVWANESPYSDTLP